MELHLVSCESAIGGFDHNLTVLRRNVQSFAGISVGGRDDEGVAVGLNWYGRWRRQDFNAVDFGIFLLVDEVDVQFAIGHFHSDGFDAGALGAASPGPDIEILEFMAFHNEREYPPARPLDGVVGFGEMQFDNIFAIRNGVRKRGHAVSFALVQHRVLGVGDRQVVGTFRGFTVSKTLVCQPQVAFRIRQRPGRTGFDANRQRHRRGFSRCNWCGRCNWCSRCGGYSRCNWCSRCGGCGCHLGRRFVATTVFA